MKAGVIILGIVMLMFALNLLFPGVLFGAGDASDGGVGDASDGGVGDAGDGGAGDEYGLGFTGDVTGSALGVGNASLQFAENAFESAAKIGDTVTGTDGRPCQPLNFFQGMQNPCAKHDCEKGCLLQPTIIGQGKNRACKWIADHPAAKDAEVCEDEELTGYCKKNSSLQSVESGLDGACELIDRKSQCMTIKMKLRNTPCEWVPLSEEEYVEVEDVEGRVLGERVQTTKSLKMCCNYYSETMLNSKDGW